MIRPISFTSGSLLPTASISFIAIPGRVGNFSIFSEIVLINRAFCICALENTGKFSLIILELVLITDSYKHNRTIYGNLYAEFTILISSPIAFLYRFFLASRNPTKMPIIKESKSYHSAIAHIVCYAHHLEFI